jgi:CDP-diacylglycerol---glycerol-3-phosphate 3-phosphatidyltransferase
MFDGRWRDGVDRTTAPIGRTLQRWGINADVLTASGLVFALGTAVAVGTGHLHLAIGLLILTGFHDLLDGPVAKAAGSASVRGAFFDSVTDRVSDIVLMGGVAWYLVSAHKGHLVLLPLAILGVTSVISYERAKAEALGLTAKGGLMERAERMILLGVGFLASWMLVPVLWVLLALTTATAVGRFVRVWQSAQGPPARETHWRHRQPRYRREGRSEPLGRWRARRQEAMESRSGRTMRARARRANAERRIVGSGRTPRSTPASRWSSARSGAARRRD